MRILILYNVASVVKRGVKEDLICEQEITTIVPLVAELLSARGYQVEVLETRIDLWEQLKALRGEIDLVLNMAEAFGETNANETLVPAMLEALDIPFTGAGAHNMHLTWDKEVTKSLLGWYGVPMPQHQIFRDGHEVLSNKLKLPLIVKPAREEASVGIHLDSVIDSEEKLQGKISDTLSKYGPPVIVEEFIEGREISVGIIGNTPDLIAFPPLEFLFYNTNSPLEEIRSYEYKWGGTKEKMVRANLTEGLVTRLVEYTKTAYLATECRDYARMDYRLDDEGNIYLLEVNYNPGIGPNTHGLNNTLTMMASFVGLTFEDLVERIILITAKRYGLA